MTELTAHGAPPHAGSLPAAVRAIVRSTAHFGTLSLAELGAAALMDRIDTKFLVPVETVAGLMERLAGHYRVLEIGGKRLSRYSTEYYDSADLQLYHHHHAGRSPRIKVRVRSYHGTGDRFLEVKLKTNKGRTRKVRVPLVGADADPLERLRGEGYFGLADRLSSVPLTPSVVVDYSRLTFVANDVPERLTLDLMLTFTRDGEVRSFPGVVVAEVKQERRAPSLFHEELRRYGVREGALSKYCLGIASLDPGAKKNRFKGILRRLEELGENGVITSEPAPALLNGHRD